MWLIVVYCLTRIVHMKKPGFRCLIDIIFFHVFFLILKEKYNRVGASFYLIKNNIGNIRGG